MKYSIIRTDTADECIKKLILYIAQNFGLAVANKALNELEEKILLLADYPLIGVDPSYILLKRQGYKVLILDNSLVFYKISDKDKTVIIYAVVDKRQDYINIINGL